MDAAPMLRARFVRLSLINILSNITVPLAGLVDTAMLGHLDDIRFLAGVALGAIIFDYIYWSFGFLRMGTTGTTAFAVGRDDTPEIYRVLYRSVAMAGAIALAVLALHVPLRELGFGLLSGTPGVEEAGRAYFDARIWGAPATLLNFALIGWLLGRERSRDVLAMTIVANVANIVLNYVFIIRMDLAAEGAGLATMLSQYCMLAVGIALFVMQPGRVAWVWREVLDRDRLGALLRLNGDIFVRTFFLVSAFGVFTNVSAILGVGVLAVNSILLRLLSLAAYMIDGAAFAAESLAGIFAGSRDLRSLRALFRLSLTVGAGCSLAVLAVFFVSPRFFLSVLTSHESVIAGGLAYAPWLIPTLIFGGLAYIYDGLFLGLTEGRRLRNAMTLSTLGVFAPICGAAAWLRDNHLLWSAMAAFMLARTLTLYIQSRAVWRGLEAPTA